MVYPAVTLTSESHPRCVAYLSHNHHHLHPFRRPGWPSTNDDAPQLPLAAVRALNFRRRSTTRLCFNSFAKPLEPAAQVDETPFWRAAEMSLVGGNTSDFPVGLPRTLQNWWWGSTRRKACFSVLMPVPLNVSHRPLSRCSIPECRRASPGRSPASCIAGRRRMLISLPSIYGLLPFTEEAVRIGRAMSHGSTISQRRILAVLAGSNLSTGGSSMRYRSGFSRR